MAVSAAATAALALSAPVAHAQDLSIPVACDLDDVIEWGDTIALRAANGQWVQAVNGGGDALRADTSAAGAYEGFTLVSANDRPFGQYVVAGTPSVNLQALNGQWVGPWYEDEGKLFATANERGSYQTFTMRPDNSNSVYLCSGATVSFQSESGAYVQAEFGGGGRLLANTGAVGSYERFQIVRVRD